MIDDDNNVIILSFESTYEIVHLIYEELREQKGKAFHI